MRCLGLVLVRCWARSSPCIHHLGVHAAFQIKLFLVCLQLFVPQGHSVKILVESQKPLLIWPKWAGKWETIHINTNDLSTALPLPEHSSAGWIPLTWLEPLGPQIGLAGLNLAKCGPPVKAGVRLEPLKSSGHPVWGQEPRPTQGAGRDAQHDLCPSAIRAVEPRERPCALLASLWTAGTERGTKQNFTMELKCIKTTLIFLQIDWYTGNASPTNIFKLSMLSDTIWHLFPNSAHLLLFFKKDKAIDWHPAESRAVFLTLRLTPHAGAEVTPPWKA